MNFFLNNVLLVAIFITLFQKKSLAQLDPSANSFTEIIKVSSSTINPTAISNMKGIVCNPNTFYALDNNNDQILEILITGTTAVVQSTVLTGAHNGIAICNNLNGGSFSPTFYSADTNNLLTYYDGTSWVSIIQPTLNLNNPGGQGNNVFYTSFSGYNKNIIKYDGTNFTTIYTSIGSQIISLVDLAVDNADNVYFIKSNNSTSYNTDSLIIISSTGNRLASYPFVINWIHAYGSFLLNGVYYIGLGQTAQPPNTPNTLIPVSFASGYPVLGTLISMPLGITLDLASCNPGLPLGINNEYLSKELNVYPNPFISQTTLKFNQAQKHCIVRITDVFGKEIRSINFSGKELNIEKEEMTPGIYFIQIIDDWNRITTRKIIIQ